MTVFMTFYARIIVRSKKVVDNRESWAGTCRHAEFLVA